jgi:hypothetical protein
MIINKYLLTFKKDYHIQIEKLLEDLFMRKIILTIVSVALALALTSCSTTTPFTATSNPVGSKMGKSEITYILIFPINSDAGIYKAAKNGGISKISTIDIKYTSFGWIYQNWDTVVTGE